MRNRNAFRNLFVVAGLCLLSTVGVRAQTVVGEGNTHTPRGIGGYTDISYAFAKGDVVTLKAKSNKYLAKVLATLYPEKPLARLRSTKRPEMTFTMPEEGIVVFRFISDRNGEADIEYTVSRTPGPGGPAEYNTKVKWREPLSTVDGRVPEREQ